MNVHELRGPALTYVTDDSLDRSEHERVLREFVASTGIHPLRVAFRLPKWSESDVDSLVDWYLELVEKSAATRHMEPPLIHDRPESTERFPGTQLWLPWRNRDLMRPEDIGNAAISIHSVGEAHEAVSVGASELVFGHVFSSESHPGEPGRGVVALLEVKDAIQVYENPPRVMAIGGIDPHTVPEVGRHRHCRVAAMRSISQSADIRETLDQMRSGWVAAYINAELDEDQRNPLGNPSSIFF